MDAAVQMPRRVRILPPSDYIGEAIRRTRWRGHLPDLGSRDDVSESVNLKTHLNQCLQTILVKGWLSYAKRFKFLNHLGEPFLIAHFAGYAIASHYSAFISFLDAAISVPQNITIVTFATANILPQCILIRQLETAGIPYVNAAATHSDDWVNPAKLLLLEEVLPKIRTEYALVLDALDVLLCGSLEPILERFSVYNQKVLFGATKNLYPKYEIEQYPNRESFGEWKWVNAGTAFGRTEALAEFYRKAAEIWRMQDKSDPSWRSEQRIVRMTVAEDTTNIGLDYQCLIFQNFAKARVNLQNGCVTIT